MLIGCCCAPTCFLVVTVRACNGTTRYPGIVVSATRAGVTVTGTTDALGQCTLAVPTGGTWSVTTSPGTHQTTSPTLKFVICPGTNSLSVTMTADPGYACCSNCIEPHPTTLHVTDNNGTWAATYGGSGTWSGGYTLAAFAHCDTCSMTGGATCCTPIGVQTSDGLVITFSVTCGPAGGGMVISYNAPADTFGLWFGTACQSCACSPLTQVGHATGTAGGSPACSLPQTAAMPSTWNFDTPLTGTIGNAPVSGTVTIAV